MAPAGVLLQPQHPEIALETRCLVTLMPRAMPPTPGSLQCGLQNTLFLRWRHFVVPERKLILEMADARIDAFGQNFIGKLRLLGCLLHDTAPGEQLGDP